MANTKDLLKDVQKHIGHSLDSLHEAVSLLTDSEPSDGDNYSDFINQVTETISEAIEQVENADNECSSPVVNGGEEADDDDEEEDDEQPLDIM